MSHIDRTKFFPLIRTSVFPGRLDQKQVDGMNIILDAWEKSSFTDMRWLGYMLGTTYHETASTMQPIKEYGTYEYFERNYGPNGRRPETARAMGNVNPGDGAKYCGRGFIQNTWANNYRRGGEVVGVDLYSNPDLAMRPDIAAKLMFAGMTDREIIFEDFSDDRNFSFTGKSLEDYFNDTTEDWYNARRIINGTQAAAAIAETSKDFYAALTRSADIDHARPNPKPEPVEPPVEQPDRIDVAIRMLQTELVAGGWFKVNTAAQVDGAFGKLSRAALDAYYRSRG